MALKLGLCKKILIGAGVAVVILIIAIIVLSFPAVEYYELGFPRSKTTGNVRTDKVYFGGRYFMGPDIEFKAFPRIMHFEKLNRARVASIDRLEMSITVYFQYNLRPHQLPELHEKFDIGYRPIIRTNALDALKNKAVYFSVREYIRNRTFVEGQLKSAIQERLSGVCCEKDCGSRGENQCVEGCKRYSSCRAQDWGLFSKLSHFQITEVRIPQELDERFLKALVLIEQNEEAKLRQTSAVFRRETSQLEKNINNEAFEIERAATANGTLIRKVATAQSNKLIEQARIEGLQHLYSELNITDTKEKLAFDYLRTLKRSQRAKLAIDFESYIAGADLIKN